MKIDKHGYKNNKVKYMCKYIEETCVDFSRLFLFILQVVDISHPKELDRIKQECRREEICDCNIDKKAPNV